MLNHAQVGEVRSWPVLFKSKEWHKLTSLSSRITLHDHATVGTEAAALALWVLVTNWHHPRQAVSVAASLGGSSMVTAQLVGAMAGALHGDAWIPGSWFTHLENDYRPQQDSKQGVRSSIGSSAAGSTSSVSGDEEPEKDDCAALPLKGARDEAVFLAKELLKLGCTSVGISQESWDKLEGEAHGQTAQEPAQNSA